MKVNTETAQHYVWGSGCDGWILAPSSELLIIEERMPPNTAEQRHFHTSARQFFYVLSGCLAMELEGEVHHIPERSGIEIPAQAIHQARNDGSIDVIFLVISSPTTRGDRTDVD